MPATRPSILLTRPRARSDAFAQALRARFGDDLDIVIAPVMQIESCFGHDPFPGGHAAVITSASAVAVMRDHMPARETPTYCVGTATTNAARDAGWQAVCAGRNGDELVETLRASPPDHPLIHLRGEHSTGQIAARLRAAAIPCSARVIYRQTEQPLTVSAKNLLESQKPVLLPLFSPRSADLLLARLPEQTGDVTLVAISAAVARKCDGVKTAHLVQAETPDVSGMLNAIAPLISRMRKLEGRGRAG